jgi:hypothetical protein
MFLLVWVFRVIRCIVSLVRPYISLHTSNNLGLIYVYVPNTYIFAYSFKNPIEMPTEIVKNELLEKM